MSGLKIQILIPRKKKVSDVSSERFAFSILRVTYEESVVSSVMDNEASYTFSFDHFQELCSDYCFLWVCLDFWRWVSLHGYTCLEKPPAISSDVLGANCCTAAFTFYINSRAWVSGLRNTLILRLLRSKTLAFDGLKVKVNLDQTECLLQIAKAGVIVISDT